MLTFRNWQGELIGDELYWHGALATHEPDNFADPDLIIDVNVNMEIDSEDDNTVIVGVDPHQDGAVKDVIQE